VPEEPKASTPRPTFLRTVVVVGVAVAAALGGGLAIAANAPAPRQTTPAPEAALDFVGIQPVRVLDTRNAAGGPIGIGPPGHMLGTGETINVAVGGVGAIPTDAKSVAINITIDEDATLKSFLTVWPAGQPKPNTSANNAEPGLVSPNSAIFQLGTDGKLSVFNQQGAVNVIIDVTGYFIAGEIVPTTTPTTTPGETTTTTTSTTVAPPTPAVSIDTGATYAVGDTIHMLGTGWGTNCGEVINITVNGGPVVKTLFFGGNNNWTTSLLVTNGNVPTLGANTLNFTSDSDPACTVDVPFTRT
jgi:hypothetical protein